jgi:ATP-dependent DNA helicase RecG
LAESLYLAAYVEKLGSGTQRIIELCRQSGLPDPDFEQRSGSFVLTMWRDRLTPGVVASLHLNERQAQALAHVRSTGRVTNTDHRRLTGATRKTAMRDLEGLVERGVLARVGERRGAHYVLVGRK